MSEANGIDRQLLDAAISQAVQKKGEKPLLKKAIEFFMPAKLYPGAAILVGNESVGVSAEAIAEIPNEISIAPDGSKASYELDGVVIDIHRSDRDQGKYGWRGVIEVVSKKKVRMELAPHMAADTLYGTTTIVGNVTVIEEADENGELQPTAYYVKEIVRAPT